MSVDMNFNIDVIGRQIESDLEAAAVQTLEGMVSDIEPYVPYKTGELTESAEIDEDSLSIVYDTEYAEYVYNMPESNNFNRDVHKKATSKWTDEAIYSNRDKWINDLKKNFSRR